MQLTVGTKLGPYEIESQAGAGGMGEVYKAKDTRLDRSVAIKVLAVQIASNPDLRQRFEREAKAISSLNHPNICILHDIGSQDGVDFLVMEYLDGETLAARLTKGPVPAQELLTIAIQTADALDKAHRQNLIHRDLKPGNIMLTKAGAKLMDFGLAKLHEAGIIQGISGITRTTPLTGEGTIIGTLQYMSPEQLEGKEADFRSDIFSFGAILYEMATGQRPFEGKSQASLIAAVLRQNPRPIAELQSMSPPMLDRVIRQCMEKDPEHRWQSAGDLKKALQWTLEGGSQAGIPFSVSASRKLRERILWGAVTLLAGAALTLGVMRFTQTEPKPKVARFSISKPQNLSTISWPRISPDGTMLSFEAGDSSGEGGIYIRPINSLDAYLLVKTNLGNSRPFWSPNSKQLAYFENDRLKKISIAGGLSQLVCEAAGYDGSWGKNGIIVFDGNLTDSIRQVPASGGIPTAASRIDHARGEKFGAWPCFLPDGEHFLYLADTSSASGDWILKVGSIKTLESTVLTTVNSRIEYANGFILYLKNDLLVAHPFDPDKRVLTGEPVPLAPNVSAVGERAFFSISDDGLLVYRSGQSGADRLIVSVNRKGDSLEQIGPPGQYRDFTLSPDNTRLAFGMLGEQQNSFDVWVRDLKRKITSRLTFGPGVNVWPVWNPDGTKVLFTSDRNNGRFNVMQRNANGTGTDELVLGIDTTDISVTSVARDGSLMILQEGRSNQNIWTFNTAGGKPEPLLSQPYAEQRGAISPDGKFLAYQSSETGDAEIYIREIKPDGGKWQVSTTVGRCPLWRADGKELYFITPNFDIMAVPISTQKELEIGAPVKLFNRRFVFTGPNSLNPYAVTSDGQRFFILAPANEELAAEFIIVENWPEELKK
ncbi:MAG: protein kinase domain-containing protein [Candidatus Zixiibacteriota bacterium]